MLFPFRYRRAYHGPIQGVVLDWAGTLLDYGSRAPVAAFLESFQRERVPVTVEEVRAFMGTYKKDHIRSLTQLPRVAHAWLAAHGRKPDESDVDRMYADFSPIQISLLAEHAELIPGCLETIAWLRSKGIAIGTNTGYSGPMMDVVIREAERQGLRADAMVCADDVPAGRPAPWMALEVAKRLGVFPMESLVKVDDTVPGIEEGLNAGMWTVGLAKTGNELGMSQEEVDSLEAGERTERIAAAAARLSTAGAHYVVEGIDSLAGCVESIERRLVAGERP